ncbi:hypothetical protein VE01_08413 [Pseudogymnoascus verrucosus]|uniref:Ribosomal RNA methyltransferase FtsJ domain-containing protein n=1 Tax=Pseudogymnoascus verrucosus TaxID=342668 RepID=A0A1B8GBW2_9PEZI|nr:uncharacterized protein VE01_08413 [Pseudogymnoascus verrucosus]OBT93322.1 hypothetical protein VE01_08413 [Pseudogymnoascus verrucosus]
MSTQAQSTVDLDEAETLGLHPHSILQEFFMQNDAFRRLAAARERGWKNERGDEYFARQRRAADGAKNKEAYRLYKMMQEIGDEMQSCTRCLSQQSNPEGNMNILDICMAPGGYTASALKYNPKATAFGISLPLQQSGHKVLLPRSSSTMLFLDVTMLGKEYGVEMIPLTHPDRTSFRDERPFWGQTFQLIFCDGQVLRTHERPEYREHYEARRLTVSQLILALQRIRSGGTIVVLLHKIEGWDTLEIIYRFSSFSSVQVFKPAKKHAKRSSFYLVASGVQPHSDAAKLAVEEWKQAWWNATFGGENGTGSRDSTAKEDHVRLVLDQFGSKFVELARPIWEIQEKALSSWKP